MIGLCSLGLDIVERAAHVLGNLIDAVDELQIVARKLGVVGAPCGNGSHVILCPLVTEEETIVAPVGSCGCRCGNQITDVVLNTTKLLGCAHTVNLVKS